MPTSIISPPYHSHSVSITLTPDFIYAQWIYFDFICVRLYPPRLHLPFSGINYQVRSKLYWIPSWEYFCESFSCAILMHSDHHESCCREFPRSMSVWGNSVDTFHSTEKSFNCSHAEQESWCTKLRKSFRFAGSQSISINWKSHSSGWSFLPLKYTEASYVGVSTQETPDSRNRSDP